MTALIYTDDIKWGCTVPMELKDRCLGRYPLATLRSENYSVRCSAPHYPNLSARTAQCFPSRTTTSSHQERLLHIRRG